MYERARCHLTAVVPQFQSFHCTSPRKSHNSWYFWDEKMMCERWLLLWEEKIIKRKKTMRTSVCRNLTDCGLERLLLCLRIADVLVHRNFIAHLRDESWVVIRPSHETQDAGQEAAASDRVSRGGREQRDAFQVFRKGNLLSNNFWILVYVKRNI